MSQRKDIVGQRFNRLLVLAYSHSRGRHSYWLVRCDCGTEKTVQGSLIKRGDTVSCGCFRRETAGMFGVKHGMRGTREYRSWISMIERAHTGTAKCSPRYIGRGVTVCERWLKFENFFADMGKRPDGTSIDRVDNDRGYGPGNCRWATQAQQQRNRRSNRLITAFGRTQPLVDWAHEVGINSTTLGDRLRRGWPVDEAVSRPSRFAKRVV